MFTRLQVRPVLCAFVLGLSLGLGVFVLNAGLPLNAATMQADSGTPCTCPTAVSASSASAASSASQDTSISSVSSSTQASVASVASSSAAASVASQEIPASSVGSASQVSAASSSSVSSATSSTIANVEAQSSSQPSSSSVASSVAPTATIGLIRMGTVQTAQYNIGAGRFFRFEDLRNDKTNNPDFSFSVNGTNLFVTTVMGVSMPDGTSRMIDGTQTAPAPGKWEEINDPEICTKTLGQLTDYLRNVYTTFTFQNTSQALCFKTRDGIVGVMGVSLTDKSFVFKAWPISGKNIPQPPAPVALNTAAAAQSTSGATSSAQPPIAGMPPIVMASAWPLEGRGLVAFDLHTARPNPKTQLTPGPENDLSITAYVTRKPEQRCSRVGGGFRSRTQCSTIYVNSTTMNLLKMGSADTMIVEIKKAYGGVTKQDCVDTITKGPVVSAVQNVQSATVVCAQSKGANGGLLYAKIGGGTSLQDVTNARMNVTIWMP